MQRLGRLNHSIVVAARVVRPVVAEEIGSAGRGSAKPFPTRILRDIRPKYARFEGILVSLTISSHFTITETLRCKRITLSLVGLLAGADRVRLDGAVLGILVTENI